MTNLVEQYVSENAHVALNYDEYKKKYDSLIDRYDSTMEELDSVNRRFSELQAKQEMTETFVQELQAIENVVHSINEMM